MPSTVIGTPYPWKRMTNQGPPLSWAGHIAHFLVMHLTLVCAVLSVQTFFNARLQLTHILWWLCLINPAEHFVLVLIIKHRSIAMQGGSHSTEWLSLDTDASKGWSCRRSQLFRVTVRPSSDLEKMPRLRDLQSVACMGPSLPFRSAATATVQAPRLPRPGVINVLLIFQASPFYLNLIKVASCLWPASLM